MAVFRVHKTQDFTVMSNHHLRDHKLSLKAKGLLSVMLSLPDDWDYSMSGLASICVEGASAVKSAMDELTEAGYVVVTKLYPNQTDSGRIEYAYDVHEVPEETTPEKQGDRKQPLENLPLEIQPLENRGQVNTKKVSTKEPSTKDKTKGGAKKQATQDLVAEVDAFTDNVLLRQTILEFMDARRAMKAPMTMNALRKMLSKLKKLAYTDDERIEILNNSIINGWKGVFPLKGNERRQQNGEQFQMRLDEYSQNTKAKTQVIHTEYVPREGR